MEGEEVRLRMRKRRENSWKKIDGGGKLGNGGKNMKEKKCGDEN